MIALNQTKEYKLFTNTVNMSHLLFFLLGFLYFYSLEVNLTPFIIFFVLNVIFVLVNIHYSYKLGDMYESGQYYYEHVDDPIGSAFRLLALVTPLVITLANADIGMFILLFILISVGRLAVVNFRAYVG